MIDGAMYSTISHHGGNGSKIMSKWNVSFANSFGSKEANMETLNRGASFLVAPHNISFNKHSKQVAEANHSRVVEGLESILHKHKLLEEEKTKGLSEELAKQVKGNKPPEVRRTEALLN